MLDTTLTTTFAPGTNLKGDVAGANWTFLLPSLELERIACFGAPAPAALATLARIGRDVVVICADARQVRRIGALIRRQDLDNIRLVAGLHDAGLDAATLDLAVVAGGARRLGRDAALQAELRRLLKPDGLLYVESGGPVDGLLGGGPPNLGAGFGEPGLFWLTPLTGEMHTAVPLHDRATTNYFQRNGLYSSSFDLRPLKLAERRLSRNRLFGRLMRRNGVLAGANRDDGPPHYLRTIARSAGVDIEQHRWGLAAHGRYSSRKVLLFLFERAAEVPNYIVKMTRDGAFNRRLENEQRALVLLHERRIGDRETLPQVVFFGHHGGLAIVGETVIEGAPFRKRTRAAADCPSARSAVDWLIDLGAATADPAVASPLQVSEGLETLFEQFARIYRLTPAHRDFLAEQIAGIAGCREPFPLVFQHGDPGVWNVLVTQSGRAAFLDWEAAEPQGMPLWDLFYFLRSFGITVARAAGTQDSLKGFEQQYLSESALSPLLADAVTRACERGGLARELVKPLFYTCWMHRALKEATRLAAARLERGHYVNLLRLCIDRRESPVLRQLFAPSAG